jgi:hypothetical protein
LTAAVSWPSPLDVRALGQIEYLEKGTERLTFLSDKREPLLVWTRDKQDNARSL